MSIFCENKEIRKLKKEDYNNFLVLINNLQNTELTKEQFEKIFLYIENTNMMEIWVIEEQNNNGISSLVGSGTIIYEQKFIHNGGKVAHIEDIVICSSKRNSGLGKKLIEFLLNKSYQNNCYKTILNCDEKICDFYKKCGLLKKNVQMAKYF